MSISIDDNKNSWQTALREENMLWQQLIIPADKQEKMKSAFNYNSIPLIVFIDKSGKEVKRFKGYDEEGLTAYKALIQPYIQ